MWNWRVVLVATLTFAQALQAQAVFIGVRAGQTSARQRVWPQLIFTVEEGIAATLFGPDESIKTTALDNSVTSGLSATLELTRFVAIETDLQLVEKGMRDETGEMRMRYGELPVLLRLGLPLSDVGIQVFFDGGFAVARETSCQGRLAFVNNPPSAEACDVWRKRKTDAGVALGGGVLFRQPLYQMTLSWRQTSGVRSLDPDAIIKRRNETTAIFIGFVARLK